ncbi:hypothetical protein R1sor_023063 [Riccia sorocarpa]|uniref:Uncharacterized protein n=1 Tax=Riccia sorocarpa TaxID=122646 RepID=A0ABD3GPM7_9MARC
MLMDARNGHVKVNPLHDPDMPMLEAENNDNDDPDNDPDDEDHDQHLNNPKDRAARNGHDLAANAEQERIQILAAENQDDCEEIVDIDTYVRTGYERDDVTRDLLKAGYTVLFREPAADAAQSPQAPVNEHPPAVNDRDIPGINGGPPAYISLIAADSPEDLRLHRRQDCTGSV